MKQMQGKKKTEATVEILMATYNGARYVEEQINSIQNQDYTDWNLTVSDDCSTDETRDIVKRLAQRDSRIHLLDERIRFGSAPANFSHLLSISTGRYVMLADQDDVWHVNKLSLFVEKMRRFEHMHGEDVPLMAFSDVRVVDAELRVLFSSFFAATARDPRRTDLNQMLVQNVVTGCAMAMNRSLVALMLDRHETGGEGVRMHDWFYALVAAAVGKVLYIDAATVDYRQHGSNVMGVGRFSSLQVWKRILLHPCRNARDRAGKTRAFIRQAEHVRAAVSGKISDDSLRILDDFIALPECNTCYRVCTLFRDGIWPYKIVNKINQIIGVCFIAK